MKKVLMTILVMSVLLIFVSFLVDSKAFDDFGYNYKARVFSGPADGVDRVLDNAVWGDSTYAKDHLKMSWSKAWDNARFYEADWTCDAWEDNQWNGKVRGGSGEVWHYKIVWVGPELESSDCWREGGYAIWGEFEVIMDQGTSTSDYCGSNNGGQQFCAHAIPTGYGGN